MSLFIQTESGKSGLMVSCSLKFLLVVCLGLLTCGTGLAQRNNIQPKDFEPLTSLPWVDNEKATLEQVIDRIFREPNIDIRYPVLGEYLRQIPVKDLGRAFDLATALEGTQTPDEVVYFLLYIWANRDPAAAWERTRTLFEVVGIEDGWLAPDTWDSLIEVQNREAIEKSRFRLSRNALLGFVKGANNTEEPEIERVKLMKKFANLWIDRFHRWPDDRIERFSSYHGKTLQDYSSHVIMAFNVSPPRLQLDGDSDGSRDHRAGCEVLWRRWLVTHPDGMEELIQAIQSTVWQPNERPEPIPEQAARISSEMLRVWHRINPTAFKAWISEVHTEPRLLDAARTGRCMIMAEVSPALRKTWIDQMLTEKDPITSLRQLAGWQPQLAMESASVVKDEYLMLADLVDYCAYGPWHGSPWNATHSGFGYLKEHRLEHLPEPLRKKLQQGWFECTFMEQWGDLDIGEAAQFGVNLLLTDLQASRKDLLATLRGSTPPQLDDGIWDRTFCALRVWAVVRPTEMKKWIATQDGEDLRSALTWLLEHPWGGPKSKP